MAQGPGQARCAKMRLCRQLTAASGCKKVFVRCYGIYWFLCCSTKLRKGHELQWKSTVLLASHQLDSFLCLDSTWSLKFYTGNMVSISYSRRHHPTRSDPNQLQPARKISSTLIGLVVVLNFRSKRINLPTIVSVVRFQKIVRGASLIFHLLAKDKIRSVSPPNINFMLTSSSSAASIADPFN